MTLTPAAVREFEEDGFVVLRGLFPPQTALRLRQHIDRLRREEDPHGDPRRLFNRWQGVTRHQEFWPVIVHAPLVAAVRTLVDGEVRYAHNSEVHANNTGYLWHRDCLDQRAGCGPDWEEAAAPYRLVRACIYLQSHEESGFELGIVPGSHRAGQPTLGAMAAATGARLQRALGLGAAILDPRRRFLPPITMQDGWLARLRPATPRWLRIGLGDCVLLHQRAMHSASAVHGPHYAIYFSYGPDDVHASRQWRHYRHERPSQPQGRLPSELARQLAAAQLLSDHDRADLSATLGSRA